LETAATVVEQELQGEPAIACDFSILCKRKRNAKRELEVSSGISRQEYLITGNAVPRSQHLAGE
jgi:hypothetical protein